MATFVRSCRLAVVATVDPSQRPEAALVSIAALDDGTLIYDTKLNSRKVENLGLNAGVAVVVGWSDNLCLQIEGVADIAVGHERAHYGTEYVRQLPGSRALDDEFAVVTIRPAWVRVYDARKDPPLIEEAHWH